MKTIEEKAKAYNKALEKFDVILNLNTVKESGTIFADDVRKIFPELVESEDERIKEKIIATIHLYYGEPLEEEAKEMIAWLEKQGEQKPQGKSALEAAKEEKNGNANKVEPKFKEGDWVVYENRVGLIVRMLKEHYIISFDGVEEQVSFIFNDKITKWTIQDAKDGDVLYLQKDGKEHIIIYKGVIKERFRTFVSAYCAYNGIVDAFCFADVSRYVDIAYGGITPATKEQRDTLMKAMADDGYEWDADKKELKKIEQKPTEWSEEDEKHLSWLIEHLNQSGELYSNLINWLKSLRPQSAWKPSDEKMEYLAKAITTLGDEGDCKTALILNDLRFELKKLREE